MLSEPSLSSAPEANRELNSQEYLAGKTRLASYPYHIQLGVDNRCNVRCGVEAQNLRAAMKEHDPPSTCHDCYEFNRDNPSVMIRLNIEHEE